MPVATDDTEVVYVPVSPEEWRRAELRRAGVSGPVALALSETDADLHVMLQAVAAGCSDGLLARIFGGDG